MNLFINVFRRLKVLFGCFSVAAVCSVASANEEWQKLATMLPDSSNAVLAINVQSLFDSPIAAANHWRELDAKDYLHQLTILPPAASKFVLGSELDLEHLEPKWEFAAIALQHDVELAAICNETKGQMDSIGGLAAVRTLSGGFIVPYASNRVGLIRLAQRQWAAQQIKLGRSRNAPAVAPMLIETINRASGNSQVALAINLDDIVPMEVIRSAIQRSGVVKNDESIDRLAKSVASIQGIEFTVAATDKLIGKLDIVFHRDISNDAELDKNAVLAIVNTIGCGLPEFEHWRFSRVNKRLSVEGELTVVGFQKVLSLLHFDTSDVSPLQIQQVPEAVKDTSTAVKDTSTEKYVSHVNNLIQQLANAAAENNLQRELLWTDRAAKTILRLSKKDVSPAVTKIGSRIAVKLADIVSIFDRSGTMIAARRNSEEKPDVQWRTQLVPYDSYASTDGRFYRYAPLSYAQVNVNENYAKTSQITAEELADANAAATVKFREAEALLSDMKRLLQP